ncbi:MAG: hypothetical protein AAF597_11575, partial [Bacteroidota bacterium]
CRDITKKKTLHTVSLEAWTNGWEPSSKNLLQDFLLREDVAQLSLYLDQLGEPCRQILLDWGYWGYSMQEIAERVGLDSADQAKRKKYKCRQRLLANLQADE